MGPEAARPTFFRAGSPGRKAQLYVCYSGKQQATEQVKLKTRQALNPDHSGRPSTRAPCSPGLKRKKAEVSYATGNGLVPRSGQALAPFATGKPDDVPAVSGKKKAEF